MRSNTQNTKSNQMKQAARVTAKIAIIGISKATSFITLGISAKQWLAILMICSTLSWSVFALPVRAALLANDLNANSASGIGIVNESIPFWRQGWISVNAKTEEWLTPWREVNVAYKNNVGDDISDKDKSNTDNFSPKEVLEKRVKTIDIQIDKKKNLQVGQTLSLAAVSKDIKGNIVDGVVPVWTSSNPDIIKINDDLSAIALKAGEVSLKAKVGAVERQIALKIAKDKDELKGNPLQNSRSSLNLRSKKAASMVMLEQDPDRPILADTELKQLVSPESNLGSPMGQTEATSTTQGAATPFRERAGIGNFGFSVPVASLSGRGMNASVGLSYNSQLWTKSGYQSNYQYTYNVDGNWLAPGFELSYGYLDFYGTAGQYSSQLILTDGDGTRHQLALASNTGYGSNWHSVYQSSDGLFVQADIDYNTSNYAITNLEITYADGKKVEYGNPNVQKRRFPVNITDINGNYISIAYPADDQLGKISDITDTLGRHILFHYDTTTQKLITVTVPAFNDPAGRLQTIRFYYEDITLSTAGRFDGTIVAPATASVLKYVYFPGTRTGFKYDYSSSYGMIYKISRLDGMQVTGGSDLTQMGSVTEGSYIVSASTRYNYPGTDIEPPQPTMTEVPKYDERTDDWQGRSGGGAAPKTIYTTSEQVNASGVGTRTTSVTSPDGTTSGSVSKANPGVWDDGLTTDSYLTSAGRTIPWTKTTLTWEPGQTAVGRRNPRVQKIETANEVGQVQATTFGYDAYNNQTLVAEHDFAAVGTVGAELRRTETTYVSSGDWIYNHLYHLPLSVKRIVNNAVVSRTEYQYDQNSLTDRANVVQYDQTFNPNNLTTYQCNFHRVCDEYSDTRSGRCSSWHTEYEYCNTYNSRHNARGNVTTIKAFADPTNENDPKAQVTTLKYDITGNAVEAGLSCCNIKTWAYTIDSQYAYPISETKGADVQLTTSATYDFNTGLMKTATDENNQVTSYEYEPDTLRQKKVIYPNNGYTLTEYSDKLITNSAQLVPGFVRTTTTLEANKISQSYNYYDGRGASIRSATQTPDGWSISAMEYDSIGRAKKSYNPFYGATPTDAVPANVKWTEVLNYDGLGRTTAVKLQDETTAQTSFAGTVVTVTDQAGKQRRQAADALGRVARVDEPDALGNLDVNGNPAQPTYYEYDGNDNLTKVTQSDGATTQERRFKYDALSRLTQEKQVEANATLDDNGVKQTSGGLWTKVLKYNANGLLIDGFDARGVNTHFIYDGINRVSQVTFSDGTPAVTYTYDQQRTGFYNKGALTRVETAEGNPTLRPDTPATATELDYDKMGRVVSHRQSIGTQTYNLSYAYNLAGQLTSETYPSGKTVNYNYDANGRLANIADTSRTYLNNLQYQGKGNALSSLTAGNGTTQTFSLNDRLQMNNQTLSRGAEVLQKYDYGYGQIDQNGNLDLTKNNGQLSKVESYIGTAKQWTQKFNYDSLGRLSESKEYRGDNGNLSYRQKFDFDRFGNLYRKNTSNPTAGQQTPLAYTPIEDADISKATNRFTTNTTYDEAGNVVTDNKFRSMSFAYDANGRMVKATKANAPDALSVYDAGGQRVAERVNDVWKFLVYDIGGKVVAEYGGLQSSDEGGVKYVFTDWQGSSRAIVSNSGFVNARMDYQAFGEEIGAGTGQRTTNQGFGASNNLQDKYALTKRDDATGLDHTWFRKNENRAGRWTSPDPYNGSMSLGNPQSFNRYSYVENEPTNYVDPSGLLTHPDADYDPVLDARARAGGLVWHLVRGTVVTVYTEYAGERHGWRQLDFWFYGNYNSGRTSRTGGGGGQSSDCDQALSAANKNAKALERANAAWDTLLNAAGGNKALASIFAAIGIRESGFENVKEKGGGGGRGIFQIDITQNPDVTEAQASNIEFAANWMYNFLDTQYKRATAAGTSSLIATGAAIHAYNSGSLVFRGKDLVEKQKQQLKNANEKGDTSLLNKGTTGNNYVTNVFDIAFNCF